MGRSHQEPSSVVHESSHQTTHHRVLYQAHVERPDTPVQNHVRHAIQHRNNGPKLPKQSAKDHWATILRSGL